MKKFLNVLFIVGFVFFSTSTLFAEDLSPAEIYYRDNIAVNDVSAKSPSLRAADDDDDVPGPGGESNGQGGYVGSPLEDAVLPILVAGFSYAVFMIVNKKSKQSV